MCEFNQSDMALTLSKFGQEFQEKYCAAVSETLREIFEIIPVGYCTFGYIYAEQSKFAKRDI